MLDEGEIEELMTILEERAKAMRRLDGIRNSLGEPSKIAVKRLRENVERLEGRLREYGLNIETEFDR